MIEATYTITQTQFVEAQKLWCKPAVRKLPGRFVLQAVGVIFGGFVGWSFKYLPLWLTLSIAASLLAMQGLTYWRRGLLRKYNYERNSERMESVTVFIDESGYRDERAAVCKGWMSWSAFNGWIEGKEVFILGRFLSFITIPKDALSAEQQEEFRSLCKAHIGRVGEIRTP